LRRNTLRYCALRWLRWRGSIAVADLAFHLHVWFPGEGFGSVVTHLVPIGEFDGPHPFSAATGGCCSDARCSCNAAEPSNRNT
jgi:hypothetical protein